MDLYLFRHEEQTGPYTEADARALVATGGVERTCLAWQEGMTDWMPLEQLIALPEKEEPFAPALAPMPVAFDRNYFRQVQKVPRTAIYAVVGFLTVSLVLLYILRRPDAPLPNRDGFNRALATVHFVAAPAGKIIVADKWDQTLVLELRPKDFEDPPLYQIVVPADQLSIDYENFTSIASKKSTETDLPSVLDRNKSITLDSPGLPELKAAVDALIAWSLTASETKTDDIQRRISGDNNNQYVFQGIRRENRYILIYAWSQRFYSIDDINSSGGTPRGEVYPVTSFARAHLWKYLFDHYEEVKTRADDYRAMKKDEAEKAKALSDDKAREAQALEQDRIDREAAVRAAEQSRLDRLFPVPSQSPAADRK